MNAQLSLTSNWTKLQLLKRLILIHTTSIKQSSGRNNFLLCVQPKETLQVSFKNVANGQLC